MTGGEMHESEEFPVWAGCAKTGCGPVCTPGCSLTCALRSVRTRKKNKRRPGLGVGVSATPQGQGISGTKPRALPSPQPSQPTPHGRAALPSSRSTGPVRASRIFPLCSISRIISSCQGLPHHLPSLWPIL